MSMRRLVLLFSIGLALSMLSAEACAQAILKNKDPFYYDEYDNAIAVTESKVFDIGYLVSRVVEQPQKGPSIDRDVYVVRFDLVVMNKSGKRVNDLCFTAHLRESLQITLASPIWYNEPVSLGTVKGGALPPGIAYSWEPFVLPEDVAILGGIELNDFYDMLVELTWDGGREIIRLDRDSTGIPDSISISLETDGPLEEDDLADLLSLASQYVEPDQEESDRYFALG